MGAFGRPGVGTPPPRHAHLKSGGMGGAKQKQIKHREWLLKSGQFIIFMKSNYKQFFVH